MSFNIDIFADGAQITEIEQQAKQGLVRGFTTNPTLMAKSGIEDYESFAKAALKAIGKLPISFEVFADDFSEMERQAKKIGTWGENIYIKIPISNTKGQSSLPLIRRLLDQNLKLNVTAILTDQQINGLFETLTPQDDVIVSIFAGRIADTGIDPIPVMKHAIALYKTIPKAKILWASPREVLNIYQANDIGCHIITVTNDLIKKLPLRNKSLEEYSLETVDMFYKDAQKAGFTL